MPFPEPQALRRMIRQAIADRPQLLRRLARTRTLNEVIEARATQAEQTFHDLMAEIPESEIKGLIAAQKRPMGGPQWWADREKQATELALSQATEFPEETRTEQADPTPPDPMPGAEATTSPLPAV